jgi:hypothetical protein
VWQMNTLCTNMFRHKYIFVSLFTRACIRHIYYYPTHIVHILYSEYQKEGEYQKEKERETIKIQYNGQWLEITRHV